MTTKKLLSRVTVAVRFLLAAIFLGYGSIKLLGGQYDYSDWTLINKDTVDGTSFVWAFYGYSPFYGRMTGLFEFLPALLLLSKRTATLGALGLFAVSLNITLMDFAFHYPSVKYFVLGYTLLLVFLLYQDRETLLDAFWRRHAQKNRLDPEVPARTEMSHG
ncbi:hypothetical protein [Amycolatopsis taiwanensis]|uniref:DoxX family protein n=1 Tax=Amycolatopsis taiwanensis TaxID=342230 RepID=A0A9W6VG00_9PSEU|nr:hypothetical protein [Amycolatopsis taiwanensis]GLY65001.1 hypothetical protein Atai01_16200 [Amycolatopsis taiwanensis]